MLEEMEPSLTFHFKKPNEISPEVLEEIYGLVSQSGEVGLSWVKDNLKRAFLISYAKDGDRVIGTMTLKRPLPEYARKIGRLAGVDLDGYLERGYSAVLPEYQGIGIGDKLLKGLVKRAPGAKIYVTIRMDNEQAIRLTRRNGMRLAGEFINQRTGHEIGVFVNTPSELEPQEQEACTTD